MCPSKDGKDRSFDISQSRCVIDGQLGRYSQPYFHLVKALSRHDSSHVLTGLLRHTNVSWLMLLLSSYPNLSRLYRYSSRAGFRTHKSCAGNLRGARNITMSTAPTTTMTSAMNFELHAKCSVSTLLAFPWEISSI